MAQQHSHRFTGLEDQFRKVMGPDALSQIKQSQTTHPVLTIGGDQLTGKSTLSEALARYFRGSHSSAGVIFRAEAKRRGITVAQLSREAKESPEIDVTIDYNLVKMIAAGSADGPTIVEGRQPAIMATYLKESTQRSNVVRLYLACDVRHQALRFIKREVSHDAYEIAKKGLPVKPYKTLVEVGEDLKTLSIPGIEKVLEIFVDNAHRDRDDQIRYEHFYGFDETLQYKHPTLYDVVIDTTHHGIAEVFNLAVTELAKLGFAPEVQPDRAVAEELAAKHKIEHHPPGDGAKL